MTSHRMSNKQFTLSQGPGSSSTLPAALEQHYSPAQVAKMWGISPETVRRMFRDEPGVLQVSYPRLLHRPVRKAPVLMRIPQSALDRVHANWSRR